MKSKISIMNERAMSQYPKLMVSDVTGVLVLFTAYKTGTCVGYKEGYEIYNPIGHYSSGWGASGWKDFTGTVELSN